MTDSPRKYIGSTGWAEPGGYDEADVSRALLRAENELVVDVKFDRREYTATLRRITSNEFRGSYTTKSRPPTQGAVSCRIFTSETGIFLFGHWFEDNQNYVWWADFDSVEHFQDEV